jgi:hypothetical protein
MEQIGITKPKTSKKVKIFKHPDFIKTICFFQKKTFKTINPKNTK